MVMQTNQKTANPRRDPPTEPGAALEDSFPEALMPKEGLEALRRTQRELKKARDYAEAIVETVPPLLVLDPQLRVKTANESFYKHFRVSRPNTENCLVYDLGNGQWDIPKFRMFLEEIQSEEQTSHLHLHHF